MSINLRDRLPPYWLSILRLLRYEAHFIFLRNQLFFERLFSKDKYNKLGNIKLHWGCGRRKLDGWVNVDGWRTPATDYVIDLRRKMPFRDESVELIFTEHVLEHIDRKVAVEILKDFYRILMPTGKIRILSS